MVVMMASLTTGQIVEQVHRLSPGGAGSQSDLYGHGNTGYQAVEAIRLLHEPDAAGLGHAG